MKSTKLKGKFVEISFEPKIKLKIYIFNYFDREIVQYSAAADSTIPSNKRKLEDLNVKQEYDDKAALKEIKQESESKNI